MNQFKRHALDWLNVFVAKANDDFILPILVDVQPRTSYGVTHAQTVYLIERIT